MPAVSAINFSVWPGAQVRLPGVYAEVNATNANTGVALQRSLIIGQMLSSGTATANEPVIVNSFADAQTLCGVGSMLANMVQQYRVTDPFGTLYVLPVADDNAGTAATGTVAIAGTATAAGTLNVYVAGQNVQVGVANGDTAAVVAGNLNSAINAAVNLPCTSSVSTSTVTLTARHKGAAAGDIDVRLNYLGAINGQVTPAGITVTITAVSGGATDPDLATALANLGNMSFDYICTPYSASPQLGEIESLLSDTTGRWSWLQEGLFGMAFTAMRGTYGSLTTYGVTNNNQHVSVMGFNDSPTPAYLWAADYTAAAAASLRVDPALPLNTVQLNVLAPPSASQFNISERNTLLFDGVSTFVVDQAGVVHIERAITTYQTNAAGAVDTSYLNVERLATLAYVIRAIRTDLQTKFSRCKLLADGNRIPGGSNAVTPKTIAMEVVAVYQSLANRAVVQNPQDFAQNIQWSLAGNGQVNLGLPIVCADQLEAIAMQIGFSA